MQGAGAGPPGSWQGAGTDRPEVGRGRDVDHPEVGRWGREPRPAPVSLKCLAHGGERILGERKSKLSHTRPQGVGGFLQTGMTLSQWMEVGCPIGMRL